MTPPALVVEIITHLPPGGAQRVALTLAERMDRSRFRPFLLAGPGGDWDARASARLGADFRSVPSLKREIGLHDALVVGDLRSVLRDIRSAHPGAPMLVHTHAPKAGLCGRLAARSLGLPVLHTLHGLPFHDGQPWMKRTAYRCFERTGYRSGDWIASVSRLNLEKLLAWRWTRPERSRVIPPCVDLSRLGPRRGKRVVLPEYGIGEEHRVVGMVASLKPPKDPLLFAEAAAVVARERPDLRFVIAGEGELRPALTAALKRLGIASRTVLTGWFDPIERLYPELDLLVLPTDSEGLPLVCIEGRACGVPVLASEVGGVRELISSGETGWLTPPRDLGALVGAMERLLDDAEVRRRLIRNGLEGLGPYSPEEMTRAYESLFDLALGSVS